MTRAAEPSTAALAAACVAFAARAAGWLCPDPLPPSAHSGEPCAHRAELGLSLGVSPPPAPAAPPGRGPAAPVTTGTEQETARP
ncbi:hypothetical protein ACFOVU_12010 [Nocardiopsis sediminis]|uniref:Secreted protein n=1 Tax=Nocardiopsis sediminis TaxID=1778267 RepID=A0ABV8FNK3_9ACTN